MRDTLGTEGEKMGAIELRTATLQDCEALRHFATELFAEELPGIFDRPAPTVAVERAFVTSRLEPDNATILVAMLGSEVVGLMDFLGGTYDEDRHVGQFGLSVAREHRDQGIGSALVAALMDWAPAHGIRRVEAHAWSNNLRAVRLYERLGFVQEAVRREAIVSGGEVLDVLVLVRMVDE